MHDTIHAAVTGLLLVYVAVGGYYRIRSQRSGEKLDRRKEGWPMMIGIRLSGLVVLASTIAWLWNAALFGWASYPVPMAARWVGVAGLACSASWLIWMFHTLGRNLTDTVVTRRDAYFVDCGPYRYVRNPMYTGILFLGFTIGLAAGTWLAPAAASLMFALLAVRTRIEERLLLECFGNQYRGYMQRVGRFVPKL